MLDLEGKDGMRSGTLLICSGLSARSALKPLMNDVHNLLYFGDILFRQIYNIDSLFSIFSALHSCSFIQQVIKLSTVDFIET